MFNIRVRPSKRYRILNKENDQYEITSLRNSPCVANGIIVPRRDLNIQAANLTKGTIIVHVGQPLALMTRMNQMQINAVSQKKTSNNVFILVNEANEPDLSDTDLDNKQKKQLLELAQSFPDVFNEKAGRTSKVKYEIKLLPGSEPCNMPPYRYAPARCRFIEDNCQQMLQQGITAPSNSPRASPVVLAPKKDGSLRFCVDYRKLNALTIRDAYPIPRIDDTLDSLQEARFLSTLDLRTGYWQVEVDEKSREKTAFITHKGLFEFNVVPYSLMNAPATF